MHVVTDLGEEHLAFPKLDFFPINQMSDSKLALAVGAFNDVVVSRPQAMFREVLEQAHRTA